MRPRKWLERQPWVTNGLGGLLGLWVRFCVATTRWERRGESEMEAALHATRRANPKRLVLAAPVASPDTIERLRAQADEVVCLATPRLFDAIGSFYDDFRQLSDEEVVDLLRRAMHFGAEPTATPA